MAKVISGLLKKSKRFKQSSLSFGGKLKKLSIFSFSDFTPKPNQGSMANFLKKYNIKEGVFIDDIKENLKTAKNFGLSTIWITNEITHHSFIDRKIEKISDLLTF